MPCLVRANATPAAAARRRERESRPEFRFRRNAALRAKREADPVWRTRQRALSAEAHVRRTRDGLSLAEVGERDGWMCYLCGRAVARGQAHVDHVVATARGGRNVPGNLALTHDLCNTSKRDLPVGDLPWAVPTAIEREALAVVACLAELEPAKRERAVSRLGWTSAEDEALRQSWDTLAWVDVTTATGRTVEAVRHRAKVLGLPKRYHRFTRGITPGDRTPSAPGY